MIVHYLKIALRIMVNHKGISLITLSGLTLGMLCTILIALYIQDELVYDRFHEQADRIYRVVDARNARIPPTVAAVLIAWPLAYTAVEQWLQIFVYRTDLSVWPFIGAGISVFIMMSAVGGTQIIRVVLKNPADILRYE